ncbi:MAG: histidine-type phosphatase [Rickettsiales bacterium]|nr:histidine-type phosphatase [Rickettsiales bacterium]
MQYLWHIKKITSIVFLICFLSLDFYPLSADENLKLIFALDLVRHGDRNPSKYLPQISNAWTKDEIKKITPLGKQKAELLGKKFREYYINKTHLLPKKFEQSLIYVRSTNFQRTKETAKSILKGIYPEESYKIKITVLPYKKDILNTNKYAKKSVPITEATDFKNHIKKSDPSLMTAIEKELENINHIFGTKFSAIRKFSHISDLMHVSKLQNKSFLKPFPDDRREKIINLSHKLILNSFTYPKFSCLYGKDFVLYISNLLESREQHKQKYFLYTAHDGNILAIAPLLGMNLKQMPPYLANLRFELLQNTTNKQLFVKTSLDGKIMKVCKSYNECPLKEFVTTLKNNIKNKC